MPTHHELISPLICCFPVPSRPYSTTIRCFFVHAIEVAILISFDKPRETSLMTKKHSPVLFVQKYGASRHH